MRIEFLAANEAFLATTNGKTVLVCRSTCGLRRSGTGPLWGSPSVEEMVMANLDEMKAAYERRRVSADFSRW